VFGHAATVAAVSRWVQKSKERGAQVANSFRYVFSYRKRFNKNNHSFVVGLKPVAHVAYHFLRLLFIVVLQVRLVDSDTGYMRTTMHAVPTQMQLAYHRCIGKAGYAIFGGGFRNQTVHMWWNQA
jgi:hypothetical protein